MATPPSWLVTLRVAVSPVRVLVTLRVTPFDYVYHGAIGGEGTVARIQFKKGAKIAMRAQTSEMGTYDEAELDEFARVELRSTLKSYSGGATPPWLDFPFSRRMRTVREVRRDEPGAPNREWTWYIDDERGVVYFVGVET